MCIYIYIYIYISFPKVLMEKFLKVTKEGKKEVSFLEIKKSYSKEKNEREIFCSKNINFMLTQSISFQSHKHI